MSLESNANYWRERARIFEESTFEHTKEWYKEIDEQFTKAIGKLKDKVAWFYAQFEEAEGVNHAEARKLLDAGELPAFKMSVEEYMEKALSLNDNFDIKVYKELEKASLRYRISKLEAITYYLEGIATELYNGVFKDAYDRLGEAYENRYYQQAYNCRGISTTFFRPNKRQILEALKQPWRGVKFSQRVWSNLDKLQRGLTDTLNQAIILGQGYNQTAIELEKVMNTDNYSCFRIANTEMANVASRAQNDMFNELGCEQVQIVATLDERTSQLCQSMDRKIIDMKGAETGVTLPPFHPNCRTTYRPYHEGLEMHHRIARDANGKSVIIDNMSYKEYCEKFNIEPVYGLWNIESEKDTRKRVESTLSKK